MKRTVIVFTVFCFSFMLIACSSKTLTAGDAAETEMYQMEEDTREGNDMKHEILTVKTVDDGVMIAVNEKDDMYRFEDCVQFHIDFESGQTIGVSYLEKEKNTEGMYELTGVKITREGPIILMPVEK